MKMTCINMLTLVIFFAYALTAQAAGENMPDGENDIVEQSNTIGDDSLAAEDESSPDGAAENTSRNFFFFLCLLVAVGILTERKIDKFRK